MKTRIGLIKDDITKIKADAIAQMPPTKPYLAVVG